MPAQKPVDVSAAAAASIKSARVYKNVRGTIPVESSPTLQLRFLAAQSLNFTKHGWHCAEHSAQKQAAPAVTGQPR